MKKFLLILLFPAIAWGSHTEVPSLPYTCVTSGTAGTYSETLLVTGNLVSTTNGVLFDNDHDVVLNLQGYSITFGTSDNDDAYGAKIGMAGSPCEDGTWSTAYNIKIINGTITHSPSSDTACDGATSIKLYRAPFNIYIGELDLTISGDNGMCVTTQRCNEAVNCYNIEIANNDLWSNARRFTSREYYNGAVIDITSSSSSGDYGAKIHGNTIHTGPAQGIVARGPYGTYPPLGRMQVYDNVITTDHRNDFYLVNQGPEHPAGQSSENSYALFISYCRSALVYNNTVRSGESYGGNRGLMIEACAGVDTAWIDVYGNDIEIHEGPNIRVGEALGAPAGRLRSPASGDTGELEYVHVHNNRFVAVGDSNVATSSYGHLPGALKYSNATRPQHVIIEENVCQAYGRTAPPYTGDISSMAMEFDAMSGDYDTTLQVINNRFESDQVIVQYGATNAGAENMVLVGDTLKDIDPNIGTLSTFYLGYLDNAWDCSGNIARDCIFEGDAANTNVSYSINAAGIRDITFERTLSVLVLGSDEIPVYGAEVFAVNAYGDTAMVDTTSEYGLSGKNVRYLFNSKTQTDSAAYNDFTLIAAYSGDTATATMTVAWNAFTDTLQLTETLGNGSEPPADTDPPVISARTITSITTSGAVVGWSTNETTAKDSVYVDGTPQAATTGTSHSATLSGLTAGTLYNLTLMSKDAAGNRATSDTTFTTEAEPAPADTTHGQFLMLLK